MIGILTRRTFIHVGDSDLAIDVAYLVLVQYYDCFVNRHRLIGEIVGYLEWEVWLGVDWLRRGAVSDRCCPRS